ncbi:MAG: phosphomannomutase/phosphoglucomutase [Nitrososphaerota archaeon]|jgi:phosphomannomutase|nr:phosphomannomutase/phosphoglucomutase [Nitrososphaerota archaeon]MDG6928395.1 phosphomannomutase/phosphoglucomutase [Nitrososphaerota archaeon]MDG6929676.1 phosphomannomutase/phosphoglucomutase [Nitrososphaerota archaeon]MDG6933053.1 phosphomannomutase/phosphoglucomutase [Nitrososphaerota archaeon]MDG6936247.1 phosphomannomutase/phosphoglucomutase [Nitrososphaerota archaeon]
MKEGYLRTFHAYDIRGIYGREIDQEFATKIADSLTGYVGGPGSVAVGMDVRDSSVDLYNVIVERLNATGNKVHMLGLVPTPAFYFAIAHLGLDGGIMVTASHNPPEYNGFKLCERGGRIIAEGFGMEKFKQIFFSGQAPPKSEGAKIKTSIEEVYVDYIKPKVKTVNQLKIIVDIGNGATFSFTKAICKGLGFNCRFINDMPDGTFPSRPSEPTDQTVGQLKEAVINEGADLGVAFDGDGDRALFVDEKGKTVRGDVAFAVLAELYRGKSNKKAVIEVNFSEAVENKLRSLGYETIVSKVGHSYITDLMINRGALIGGEISGHYYFADMYGLDDAMFAWIKMVEYISNSGTKLSELVSKIKLPPSSDVITVPVEENKKELVMAGVTRELSAVAQKVIDIDGIKAYFDDGWVLVRKSNTMPQIKIKSEGTGYLRLLNMAKGLVLQLSSS